MAIKNIIQSLDIKIINIFRIYIAVFMVMPFNILSDNHQMKLYITSGSTLSGVNRTHICFDGAHIRIREQALHLFLLPHKVSE